MIDAALFLERTRRVKVLLSAAAAAGFVLVSAAAVFSAGPPWTMNTDGVMMPDNRPPPTSGPHPRYGAKDRAAAHPVITSTHVYAYGTAGSSYTITRDGQPWLTVKPAPGGGVALSDPGDSQGTVLTIVPKKP